MMRDLRNKSVNFAWVSTKADYNNLANKEEGTIYFIRETGELYVNGNAFGRDPELSSKLNSFIEKTNGDIDTINIGLNQIRKDYLRNENDTFYGTLSFSDTEDATSIDDSTIKTDTVKTGKITSKGSDNIIDLEGKLIVEDTTADSYGGQVVNVQSARDLAGAEAYKAIDMSKGITIAPLDDDKKINPSYLPSYVSDVKFVKNFNELIALAESGEASTGVIYVTEDDNKSWRYGGNKNFVSIGDGNLTIGETASTAFSGSRGVALEKKTGTLEKNFESHVTDHTNPHNVTKSEVGLSRVENYGVASKDEAEIGYVGDKYMTPKRTKEAIDYQVSKMELKPKWEVVS